MKQYTDNELLKLLNNIESDRSERKETFQGDARKTVRQAVCAFANDLPNYNTPGILFIGAKDNGEPSGIKITDELLRAIADIRSDGNILPLPALSLEKRTLNGHEMVVITVMPSDMPPVRYDGRIWIRTGPRRSVASEQEERILNEKRRFKDLPFDLYPIPTAKLSDLSRSIFENEYLPEAFAPDVLEENGRSYEEQLASCKMIVSPDDTTPTVTGLLAIGKNPQDFIRGAAVQFLRIDGCGLADPVVDEERIGGSIVYLLQRAEEKLRSHNRRAVDVTSAATHKIDQTYPLSAVHQILYNALLHRTYEGSNAPVQLYWYNDRIEIISPGGPYGNVTAENFGKPGIIGYRNPDIADIMKIFGYVQSFGRGIEIAHKGLHANGNPPMEFNCNQSIVQCIIRRKE